MITEADIVEIQAIAKEEMGVDLTKQQAMEEGERWLAAFKAILKLNENDYENSYLQN